jgi:hypothetical protein
MKYTTLGCFSNEINCLLWPLAQGQVDGTAGIAEASGQIGYDFIHCTSSTVVSRLRLKRNDI